MKTYRVTVLQTVDVTLDETKFTEAYLADFRKTFYPFHSIADHAEHLAQLVARGLIGDRHTDFIEGYGQPANIGFDSRIVAGENQFMGEVGKDPHRPKDVP